MLRSRKTSWGNVKPPVGSVIDWGDPINAGLVGCWLLNENGGRIAKDIASRQDGTLTGTIPWTPGARGPTVAPDGSSGYVTAGVAPSIGGATGCTISGWIYRSATGTKNCFGYGSISSAGKFNCLWFTDNNIYADFNASFPLFASTKTGWHHLLSVFDGNASTKQRFYFDGVQVTLSGTQTVLTVMSTVAQLGALWIGREQGNGFCAGQHDIVRAYVRALTSNEAWRLYSEPFAGIVAPRRRIVRGGAGGLATYTAAIAASIGPATASLTATFVKPTYTASIASSIGHATTSLAATFAVHTYTATIAAAVGHATTSLVATFTKPTYTGVLAATAGPATTALAATFTKPSYTGVLTAAVGHATTSVTATFAKPTYTGAIAAAIGHATLAASAIFAAAVYVGTVAATVGAATAHLTATFTATASTIKSGGSWTGDTRSRSWSDVTRGRTWTT